MIWKKSIKNAITLKNKTSPLEIVLELSERMMLICNNIYLSGAFCCPGSHKYQLTEFEIEEQLAAARCSAVLAQKEFNGGIESTGWKIIEYHLKLESTILLLEFGNKSKWSCSNYFTSVQQTNRRNNSFFNSLLIVH